MLKWIDEMKPLEIGVPELTDHLDKDHPLVVEYVKDLTDKIKEQQEEIEKLKKENSLMYNTLQDYKHDLPGQDYEDVCRILGQLNKQNND